MTILQALLSFSVVAMLLTILPGIDSSLVLRQALVRGRGTAIATGVGICLGSFVWGVAAAVGAAALLAASEFAYRMVTWLGAAYMIVLGGTLLWKAVFAKRQGEDPRAGEAVPSTVPASPWRAGLVGLASNLANPKVGVFYVATIPQFIPHGASPVLMGLALAAVHAILTVVWFGALILLATYASRWLRRPRTIRAIDGVTGTVLVGFGAKLIASPTA